MTTAILVALLVSFATAATVRKSGAAGGATPSADSRAQGPTTRVSAPERCRSARRAVVHYRALTWLRQDARDGEHADRTPIVRGKSCHWARYAVKTWVARAAMARKTLAKWLYDYAWWIWLPKKWQRVFHCETPTDGHYINWQHNSGTYEGGPGFYYGTWDAYKPAGAPHAAYLATPREQYQAALSVHAEHGYRAWGCGGA